MNNLIRVSGVLACAGALIASASAPTARRIDTVMKLTADIDSAWSAVIDVFAEHNWPIQTTDKQSGLIATDWMRLSDDEAKRFADCGGSGLASVERAEIRFNVRVKEEGTGSTAAVNALFREWRSFDGKVWPVDCVSTGGIERDMHAQIDDRSKTQKPKKKKAAAPAVVKAEPRGFFCASSPSNADVGACARSKAACETTHAALAAAVPDLAACTLRESAWCVGDHCAVTEAGCAAQIKAAGVVDDCSETF